MHAQSKVQDIMIFVLKMDTNIVAEDGEVIMSHVDHISIIADVKMMDILNVIQFSRQK